MALSEAAVQAAVRVRAGELGVRLFRNNSGACEDATGRIIRYGLGNDSAQLNKRIKSSDLIGWVTSTVKHHGDRSHAVFVSIECKREDWHANPARYNDREKAQQAWIDLVRHGGGVAGFVRTVAEFEKLLTDGP